MKDWMECESCGTEFRVISDTDETVSFCPYCGSEVEPDEEDEEEFEEDEDYDFED
jgi:rRNA maturation endonuclease Nob1